MSDKDDCRHVEGEVKVPLPRYKVPAHDGRSVDRNGSYNIPCNSDVEALERAYTAAKIEIERLRARIAHCDKCGGDYAVTGLNSRCYCEEIAMLRAELSAWKEPGEHHDLATCQRGPLCPYCEIARLKVQREALRALRYDPLAQDDAVMDRARSVGALD